MLTRASRAYFESNAEGTTEHPILTPRGLLHFALPEQLAALDAMWAEVRPRAPDIQRVDARDALALHPALRPEQIQGGIYEPDAMDMDVHALHEAYLRRLRADGGKLVVNAAVESIERGAVWTVRTPAGGFSAPVLVNAAGAWADDLARRAGIPSIGVEPRRRTAFLVAAPAHADISAWPMAINVEETFYFKPDAGKIFVSPADETPSPPCDCQPDDFDVAVAVDRLEQATTITVQRVEHKWAGLRSFVADRSPVVGFDQRAEGFFWLAAQGGYGIHTSHALARCAQTLLLDNRMPEEVLSLGVDAQMLSPARFEAATAGEP